MVIRRESPIGAFLAGWIGPFTVAVAIAVGVTVARRLSKKFDNIFRFVAFTPVFMFTVKFDRVTGALNPFLRFPRNRADVVAAPRRFFRLIQATDLPLLQKQARCRTTATPRVAGALLDAERVIPKDAVMTSFESLAGIATEPLKNKQLGVFRVGFTTPASPPLSADEDKKEAKEESETALLMRERQLTLFVKFASERGVTVFLMALGSAFVPVAREVAFYRHVAPLLNTIRVPRCIAAFHSRAFSRMCIVLEHVGEPWHGVSDAVGATPGQVSALTAAVASVHGRFWRPPAEHPQLSFIDPDQRRGLGWLALMDMYLARSKEKWLVRLWPLLGAYFADSFVCLSHGDNRPGNMLFAPRASSASDEWGVIMTDWEALSVTPFLWDHTYLTTIGQATEQRRALYDAQLQQYLAALFERNRGAERDLRDRYGDEQLIAALKQQRALLVVIIFYFGVLLQCVGGVGEQQGNTEGDTKCWGERIGNAILELVDATTFARVLAPEGGAAGSQAHADLEALRTVAAKMVTDCQK